MLRLHISLALRYLGGRKLRTFLTTLAIVFGVMVVFGTNMLMPAMLKTLQGNLLAASGQVDVTITHKTGEAFSSRVLNSLKPLNGLSALSASLSRTINIPEGYYGKARISALTLTGIDPQGAVTLHRYPLEGGRFLRTGDTNAAVIAASLAKSLELALGDKLVLPTTEGSIKLRVVGILPERSLPGNEEVLVTLSEAQKLLGLSERVNQIEINLESLDTQERQRIQQRIEAEVGPDFTLGALAGGSEVFASMKTGQMAFNLIGGLAMFMGAFIIFNTFRTIVAERRHDIGMLRAIGADRRTIISLILMEGLIQGLMGTLAGIFLGYLMGAGLLVMMAPMMSQFLHLEMSAPIIEPGLVLVTLALGVGMTLLAGLLPAWSAGRVTPLEALRPPVTEGMRRIFGASTVIGILFLALSIAGFFSGQAGLTALGALLFLLGLVLVAPVLVRPITSLFSGLIAGLLAQGGTAPLINSSLARQPARAAITASTTMIGLAIIVGVGGMIWSVSGGFLEVLQRSLGSDYLIMPPSVGLWGSNVGAGQSLGDRLRAVPGVGVVSSLRFASTNIDGKTVAMLGIDPQAYSQVASLTFQKGTAATAFAELNQERTVIANGILAAQLGLQPGQMVSLATPSGLKPYRVVGVAGDYLNAKIMTAYISQDNLQKDFRKDEDILFQLNLEAGADPARVEPRLQHILEDYEQFKLISGQGYFEQNRQVFNAIFAVYFVLLGMLATPSLIALLNTLSIGVIERTREIGMVRAIGATRRQVRRMVLAESLLLAAIGTALGLLAGLYLGYVMVLGLSTGGFPVQYVFPYAGLLAAVATGLVFGILAALLPAGQAARMDIVRALLYD